LPRGRQPPPDPLRKIRFREAARDIVAKDRYDRKYGMAVDTAGAIARAGEGLSAGVCRRPVAAARSSCQNAALRRGASFFSAAASIQKI